MSRPFERSSPVRFAFAFLQRPGRRARATQAVAACLAAVEKPEGALIFYAIATPGHALDTDRDGNRAKPHLTRADPEALVPARLLLAVPEANRQIGFLAAEDGAPLALPGMNQPMPILPFAIEWNEKATQVRLSTPARLNLVAGPDDASPILSATSPADLLDVQPLPPSAIGARLATLLEGPTAAIAPPLRWTSIVASLEDHCITGETFWALIGFLPPDELDGFVRDGLLAKDIGLPALAAQPDRWAGPRMAALKAWLQDRDLRPAPGEPVTIAQNGDLPGCAGRLDHTPSLGLTMMGMARRAAHPRRMCCILGSARNEGPYLLEWIAYHRSIGFDHVFIYTNQNSDGSDDLLRLLAGAGIVTWLENEAAADTRPQFKAYAHALSVLPQTLDYRWTLVADIDEFLGFDKTRFASAADYLAWQEGRAAEAVALPWLLHVASPKDVWRDLPSIDRFPMRDVTVNHHVKSAFRTNLHWSSNPHVPQASLYVPTIFRSESGGMHTPKMPENIQALAHDPTANAAWIAHYIFRSAPEALVKALRRRGDMTAGDDSPDLDGTAAPFLRFASETRLVSDGRMAACGSQLAAELTRLRTIPGVARCELALKAEFEARMERACLEFIRPGMKPDEPRSVTEFRTLLMRQRRHALFAA